MLGFRRPAQPKQIVSKTLIQNEKINMTLFSFDKGEEISTPAAGGDTMATVLEGIGRFTVGDQIFFFKENETLIMPKDINIPTFPTAVSHSKLPGSAAGKSKFLFSA